MITYSRMPVREWDGASYDRISETMEALGLDVLDRLELRGDEPVLDAGCGSGRITQALIERLPRGRVIAIDESPSMIAAARERLGPDADLRVGDLLELELERARRRDPLDRHLPLDHRPRAAVRAPARGADSQEGGWSRSAGERATSTSCAAGRARCSHTNRTPSTSSAGRPPWNYAGPAITRERLLGAGFQRGRVLAPARAPRTRGPARVPLDDRARPARAAAARGAARAVHGRRARGARRAGGRRLRAPEHRRHRVIDAVA